MVNFMFHMASNSSEQIYDNSLSKFTNNLPHNRVFKNENLQVSVESLTLDSAFSNLPTNLAKFDKHMLIKWNKDEDSFIDSVTFKPRIYNYNNLHWLVLSQLNKFLAQKHGIKFESKENSGITFSVDSPNLTWCVEEETAKWLGISPILSNPTLQSELVENDSPLSFRGRKYREFFSGIPHSAFNSEFGKQPFPKSIKIEISHLKPIITSDGFCKIIKEIPYENFRGTSVFHFESERREYHTLENIDAELTVKLLDENSTQLNLVSGQPTFITFHITNEHENMIPIYIDSRDCSSTFSNNKAMKFSCELPHYLKLDHNKYQIALSSIDYPSAINISPYLPSSDFYMGIRMSRNELKKVITFEDKEIFSLKDLITIINLNLNSYYKETAKLLISATGGIYLETYKDSVFVTFSPKLLFLLGKGRTDEEMEVYVAHPKKQKFAESNFNALVPHTLLLFCDILKPSIIGDKFAPILKIIPHKPSSKNRTSYEAQHLEFVDLAQNNISVLSFELKDSTNDFIKFKSYEFIKLKMIIKRKNN